MPRSASSIQTSLDLWYSARDAIATGQSYAINGRTLSRASLDSVNKTIDRLERELAQAGAADAGASGVFRPAFVGGMGYLPRTRIE